MKKGLTSFLMVLGFAFVNLLIFLLVFILLYLLYSRLIAPSVDSRDLGTIIGVIIFIISVAASYGFYQLFSRLILKNPKLAALLEPVFAGQKKIKSNEEDDQQ